MPAGGKREGAGHPTDYTEEAAREICERLSGGEPLAWICKDAHMPAVRTVSHWKQAHPEFRASFRVARKVGYDAIAAQALKIADTPKMGRRVEIDAEGKERVIKEDMLGHRRLQVETRLKLLAKWDWERYGDRSRQEVTGAGGGPVKTESKADVSGLTVEQLRLLARIPIRD